MKSKLSSSLQGDDLAQESNIKIKPNQFDLEVLVRKQFSKPEVDCELDKNNVGASNKNFNKEIKKEIKIRKQSKQNKN